MSMPSHQSPVATSEDPHGEHAHDHGHTIVDWKILVGVLAVLLAFTALTVSASQAERWIADAFDVVLPNWVNVAVAMSIATVKGILVMMFFMQLRYDNLFNTVIMLFCFLAFGLFLGFTAGDLSNRAWIEPWKMRQISAGGLGLNGTPLVWQARINVATRRNNELRGLDPTGANPDPAKEMAWRERLGDEAYEAELAELALIMDRAGIEAYIAQHGLEHYFERLAHYDPRAAGHHASHDSHASTGSTEDRSRPRVGLSGALSTSTDHDDHGHNEDAAHGAAEHAEHTTDTERPLPPGLREGESGVTQPGEPLRDTPVPPASEPTAPH